MVMRNYQSLSLVICLCLITNICSAFSFGVKASRGISRIEVGILTDDADSYELKSAWRPSGNLGFSIDWNIKDKSAINLDLLFNQIEGELETNYSETEYISSYSNINFHFSYISIPIYFEYSFNSFEVGIGVQNSLLVKSKAEARYEITYNTAKEFFSSESEDYRLFSFDFGPKILLSYNFSERFTLNADFYYGWNQEREANEIRANAQQLLVGVNYKLYSKEK